MRDMNALVGCYAIDQYLQPAIQIQIQIQNEDRPDWFSMTPKEFFTKLAVTGHCSALIRATADLSEIFLAHSRYLRRVLVSKHIGTKIISIFFYAAGYDFTIRNCMYISSY
jgi:hypothetical protein